MHIPVKRIQRSQKRDHNAHRHVLQRNVPIILAILTVFRFPHPKDAKGSFRLTRDWNGWPSFGVIENQVYTATSLDLALMADLAFETLKTLMITSRQTVKTAKAIESGTDVEQDAHDEDVVEDVIAEYETSLLDAIEHFDRNADKNNKIIVRRGAKIAGPMSVKWKVAGFIDEDAAEAVDDLDEKDLEELFVRLCKTFKSRKTKATKPAAPAKAKGKTKAKGKGRAGMSDEDEEDKEDEEDNREVQEGSDEFSGGSDVDVCAPRATRASMAQANQPAHSAPVAAEELHSQSNDADVEMEDASDDDEYVEAATSRKRHRDNNSSDVDNDDEEGRPAKKSGGASKSVSFSGV